MIKVNLVQSDCLQPVKIECYDSISRIPLSVKIEGITRYADCYYLRNMDGFNFVEFRFSKDRELLFEITAVSLDASRVENVDEIFFDVLKEGCFNCALVPVKDLHFDEPMRIVRSHSGLQLIWNDERTVHYRIGENVLIGVNTLSEISQVVIEKLSEEEFKQIFG